MEDKFQELFEIRDSRINVREIMEEIESKLKKNPSTKEEIDKLTHWKFSPPGPEGYRDFDPSE
ncbi:LIC_10202 family protein, partial [Leptospira ellisii]